MRPPPKENCATCAPAGKRRSGRRPGSGRTAARRGRYGRPGGRHSGPFAAVRGVAYLVAWRLSGHDSDLDHAVQWLSTATQAEPTQTRAANLALALLDAAPLGARLAVLSGCATGRTAITHADEGLALASARPPAEALRSAQTKAIAANSRTANWAAFVLLGQ